MSSTKENKKDIAEVLLDGILEMDDPDLAEVLKDLRLSKDKPTTNKSHSWASPDSSTCEKCGDKDWFASEFCDESKVDKITTKE